MKPNKFVDIQLDDKSWILPGSVRTHTCPPEEKCYVCGGRGSCTTCAGRGEIRCEECGGKGVKRCRRCGGGGRCSFCHGTGLFMGDKCPECRGSGICQDCKGSGTYECYTCNGSGFKSCYSCGGTGNCRKCEGSGTIICSRCLGTGYYQTYLKYYAHYCVRQFVTPGPTPEFIEGLRLANGTELCKYIAKYWRKPNYLQFDNTQRCFDKVIAASGEYANYAKDFQKEYDAIPEMNDEIEGYKPYMNLLRANKIPCTRIKYILNNKEYEMVFMGTNGILCYDDVPSSVKLFETSTVEQNHLKQTAYSRHLALAALTTYIFNLDGMDISESSHLNLLLKHMCLNALERDRKVKYLRQRYTADISADVMLDNVKCLLTNKKTICYVWQCIAIDKQISQAEQLFFDKLVARYNISETDISSLKRFSSKFATLDSEQFVKEYLESPAVYRDPNYILWNFVLYLLLIATITFFVVAISNSDWWMAFIFSFVVLIYIFGKHNPFFVYNQNDIDRVYKDISKQPELTEVDYKKCEFPYSIWHKIVEIMITIAANIGLTCDKFRSKWGRYGHDNTMQKMRNHLSESNFYDDCKAESSMFSNSVKVDDPTNGISKNRRLSEDTKNFYIGLFAMVMFFVTIILLLTNC